MTTTAFCADCDFRARRRLRFFAGLAVLRHSHREHRGEKPFGVWLFGRDSWRVPVQRLVCRLFGHSWIYPEQNRFFPKPSHCEVCTRTPRGTYLNKAREGRGEAMPMTREQFETKSVREAQRALRIPDGWWGTYREVRCDKGRVRFVPSGRHWAVYQINAGLYPGTLVSKHDSRASAISRARKLAEELK